MEKVQSAHDTAPTSVLLRKGSAGELHTPEWELAQRVVASQSFARSVFLTNFLLYVCDRKLRGHQEEISEYQIGIQALGRRENYHPGEDNIVRNYARMLRKRLEEYFGHEGRHEPIRIVIPRGQYVPVFEKNDTAFTKPSLSEPDQGAPVEVVTPAISATPFRFRRVRRIWVALASILVVGIFWVCFRQIQSRNRITAYRQFWSELFLPGRATFVITGDSGFAMLQEMTGREVHLHEYVTGAIEDEFSPLPIDPFPAHGTFGPDRFSNYTSTADLHIVVGLARLPEFQGSNVKVRYARDVRLDDINQANVVLLGGPRANPWVELYEPHSMFKMKIPTGLIGQHLDERIVVNKQPKPGEQHEYSNLVGTEPHDTYTILSFLPRLDGDGWALILQGQNMAATEAAGDFALNPTLMTPVLEKARRSDGSIGPFELLLETSTVGADAPLAHIVLERFGSGH